MRREQRGDPPHPIHADVPRDRQLTWGECIALRRWIQQDIEAKQPQSVRAYMRLLETVPVCTTCGWSEDLHTGEARNSGDLFICAHFVHRPVDNFSR
jgi:hypothetical protein